MLAQEVRRRMLAQEKPGEEEVSCVGVAGDGCAHQ